MIRQVIVGKRAQKNVEKLPAYIADLFQNWIRDVEERGLEEVRKIPGYHDEPLWGNRAGQRSIRLTRSYRAFYRIIDDYVVFVLVEEVNKHEY